MPKMDNEPCPVPVPKARFSAYDEGGRRICKFRDWSVWFTEEALAEARKREPQTLTITIDAEKLARDIRRHLKRGDLW